MSRAAINAGGAVFTVEIRDRITRELSRMQRNIDSFGKSFRHVGALGAQMRGLGEGVTRLGQRMTLTSAAMAAPFVAGIKAVRDFEKEMATVRAFTKDIGFGDAPKQVRNLESLRDSAKDLGATTARSAAEASMALAQLARAGFSTAEQLSTIKPVIQFSIVAGDVDVTEVTEKVLNVMSSLGRINFYEQSGLDLQAGLTTDLAVMTKAAATANVTVLEMAESIAKFGALAQGMPLGNSIAAMQIIKPALADAAIAGTSFRGVLLRLSNLTPKAAEELRNLGINLDKLKDAGGELDLVKSVAAFEKALEGLSGFAQRGVLGKIFDNRQVTAMAALVNAGADELQRRIDDINVPASFLQEMIDTLIDNLPGSLKIAASAITGFFIEVGAAIERPLRQMTDAVARTTEVTRRWVKENQNIVQLLAAFTVGFGALSVAVLGLGVAMSTLSLPLIALSAVGTITIGTMSSMVGVLAGLLSPIGLVGAGLVVAGGIFTRWAVKSSDAVAVVKSAFSGFGAGLKESLGRISQAFQVAGISGGLKQLREEAVYQFELIAMRVKTAFASIRASITASLAPLATRFRTWIETPVGKAVVTIAKLVAASVALKVAFATMGLVFGTLFSGLSTAFGVVALPITMLLAGVANIKVAFIALKLAMASIVKAGITVAGTVAKLATGFVALGVTIASNPVFLVTAAFVGAAAAAVYFSGAVGAVADAFRGLGKDVKGSLSRVQEAFSQSGITGAVAQVKDEVVYHWELMGMRMELAWRKSTNILLTIAEQFSRNFFNTMSPAIQFMSDTIGYGNEFAKYRAEVNEGFDSKQKRRSKEIEDKQNELTRKRLNPPALDIDTKKADAAIEETKEKAAEAITIDEPKVPKVPKAVQRLTEAVAPGRRDSAAASISETNAFAKAMIGSFTAGVSTSDPAAMATESQTEVLASKLDEVVDAIEDSDSIAGALASGGGVKRGRRYLVGEEGPELFVPKQTGDILSNPETMKLDGEFAGGSITAAQLRRRERNPQPYQRVLDRREADAGGPRPARKVDPSPGADFGIALHKAGNELAKLDFSGVDEQASTFRDTLRVGVDAASDWIKGVRQSLQGGIGLEEMRAEVRKTQRSTRAATEGDRQTGRAIGAVPDKSAEFGKTLGSVIREELGPAAPGARGFTDSTAETSKQLSNVFDRTMPGASDALIKFMRATSPAADALDQFLGIGSRQNAPDVGKLGADFADNMAATGAILREQAKNFTTGQGALTRATNQDLPKTGTAAQQRRREGDPERYQRILDRRAAREAKENAPTAAQLRRRESDPGRYQGILDRRASGKGGFLPVDQPGIEPSPGADFGIEMHKAVNELARLDFSGVDEQASAFRESLRSGVTAASEWVKGVRTSLKGGLGLESLRSGLGLEAMRAEVHATQRATRASTEGDRQSGRAIRSAPAKTAEFGRSVGSSIREELGPAAPGARGFGGDSIGETLKLLVNSFDRNWQAAAAARPTYESVPTAKSAGLLDFMKATRGAADALDKFVYGAGPQNAPDLGDLGADFSENMAKTGMILREQAKNFLTGQGALTRPITDADRREREEREKNRQTVRRGKPSLSPADVDRLNLGGKTGLAEPVKPYEPIGRSADKFPEATQTGIEVAFRRAQEIQNAIDSAIREAEQWNLPLPNLEELRNKQAELDRQSRQLLSSGENLPDVAAGVRVAATKALSELAAVETSQRDRKTSEAPFGSAGFLANAQKAYAAYANLDGALSAAGREVPKVADLFNFDFLKAAPAPSQPPAAVATNTADVKTKGSLDALAGVAANIRAGLTGKLPTSTSESKQGPVAAAKSAVSEVAKRLGSSLSGLTGLSIPLVPESGPSPEQISASELPSSGGGPFNRRRQSRSRVRDVVTSKLDDEARSKIGLPGKGPAQLSQLDDAARSRLGLPGKGPAQESKQTDEERSRFGLPGKGKGPDLEALASVRQTFLTQQAAIQDQMQRASQELGVHPLRQSRAQSGKQQFGQQRDPEGKGYYEKRRDDFTRRLRESASEFTPPKPPDFVAKAGDKIQNAQATAKAPEQTNLATETTLAEMAASIEKLANKRAVFT